MTHFREKLTIMEGTTTTFGKQHLVSMSRSLAIFLVILFVGCMVGTGLLVYHLSSSSCSNFSNVEETTNSLNNKYLSTETTTLSDVEKEIFSITEVGSVITSTVESTKTDNEVDVRLPESMHPDYYNIKLIPFIQEGNFTFHGDVTILINITETCDNITLHAADLIIDNVMVFEYLETNKFLPIKDVVNETKRQFLIIYLNEPVSAGKQYCVNIKFRGILNDLLQGFYRSSYKEQNQTKWIATTQFQATDARKAFPCFDEPALKARFQISLARMKNMSSISNMRQKGEPEPVLDLPDYVWDHYEESLPMSTYLLAFVISDFKKVSNGTLSVWVRPGALSQTKYSLQIGPEILKYYEHFFGIKYPLPKIDMVGLPDFSAGAMENWGLITYRESVLLHEEGVSSKESLQRIAHVIAHELAHQWFGNLVTPVWWSDLWLNEGFATYVEFLGANAVNPHLKELDNFVTDLHGAFMLDALKSSHQISVKVNNPDEIGDIFDRISYSKGAAILRMMQNFLSMEVFQRGLKKYLESHMYDNAEQDDLWLTLTVQSHQDNVLDPNVTIKEIMDTWTLQTGFPVVSVTRNYENNSISFRQERFYLYNSDIKKSYFWWIPITYTDNTKIVKSTWLHESSIEINNVNISKNNWLIVNVNQTGYYRVNYDKENWELIIRQLKTDHQVFDPKNRAQLINDAMNLASAGYLSFDVALNVFTYLIQEREYVAWKAAFTCLDYLYEMFIKTAHFDKFKVFMIKLLENFYEELGFDERAHDDPLKIYNRYEVYLRACKLGLRSCLVHSVQHFQNWKNSHENHNTISENMRELVYCTAISVGGQEEWDFAWQRYLKTNVGNEKEILLIALGCSKETWILSRYLEWAITDNSGIRKHDTSRVFAAVVQNPIGQDLAYRFLKTNWDRIRLHLGSSSMLLSSIVRSCTIKFNTQTEVDNFKIFLKSKQNEFGIALRTAQQSIEQGEANINWMKNNFEKIVKWLSTVN